MPALSDHLLRTLAAVPPQSRVLDLGCGRGRLACSLAQLGFDLHACDPSREAVADARERVAQVLDAEEAARRVIPAHFDALEYPDDYFDWVVAVDVYGAAGSERHLRDELAETRRVLQPGGWVYLTVPAVPEKPNPADPAAGYAGDSAPRMTFTRETLGTLMEAMGFAEALTPERVDEGGQTLFRAIYRRVEPDTPV